MLPLVDVAIWLLDRESCAEIEEFHTDVYFRTAATSLSTVDSNRLIQWLRPRFEKTHWLTSAIVTNTNLATKLGLPDKV